MKMSEEPEEVLDQDLEESNAVLLREYMKACIRARSPEVLDSLDDEELRATWLASGRPRVPFGEWRLALFSGAAVPEDFVEEVPEEVVVNGELDEEGMKKANEAFVKPLKAKRETAKRETDAPDDQR